MRIPGIVAAAMVGLFTMPAPASAYAGPPLAPAAIELVSRVGLVQRWDDRRDGRRYDRGRGYDRRADRGGRRGLNNRRWRWRTACHSQWRGGQRERVCRRIRYR